jgi:predicted ATPase
VPLSGEAGIGKSRLVTEARAEASASGVRVLQGSAFELDRALPYGPIADLLRALVGSKSPQEVVNLLGPAVVAVGRLLRAVGAWLPPHFDEASARALSGPDLDSQQLLQGLLLAFERALRQGPTMIVIEDIHWADEASLELLLHLARSTADRPLLLLLTLRSEDAGPSSLDFRVALERQRLVQELALAPLDRSEVEAMVHCLVGGKARLDMLETIVGLTEGNPFFIEEVVRSASSPDDTAFQSSAVRVPRSVHDAVLLRVNRLSESARRAFQFAAVVGRRFDFAVLQRLLGIDERELLPIARELIAAQLIVEDAADRLAFRHA